MKMTKPNLILTGLTAVSLLATPGCWTQHGSQPGGGGSAAGSFGSANRPASSPVAAANASHAGTSQDAQLAGNGNGNPVLPLNP